MAATETRRARNPWPIVYGHRTAPSRSAGTALAWIFFLGLGLPFFLMTILTVLARAGIYVELFRPLWQPWPPEVLKPFLGIAAFVATLGYLAFRVGQRRGFRAGIGVGMSAIRTSEEARAASNRPAPEPEAPPAPPPPPPDAPESET